LGSGIPNIWLCLTRNLQVTICHWPLILAEQYIGGQHKLNTVRHWIFGALLSLSKCEYLNILLANRHHCNMLPSLTADASYKITKTFPQNGRGFSHVTLIKFGIYPRIYQQNQ